MRGSRSCGRTSPDAELTSSLRVVPRIKDIPRESWDALLREGSSPFVEHTWLDCLEEAKCVGEAAGWIPQHLALYESDASGEARRRGARVREDEQRGRVRLRLELGRPREPPGRRVLPEARARRAVHAGDGRPRARASVARSRGDDRALRAGAPHAREGARAVERARALPARGRGARVGRGGLHDPPRRAVPLVEPRRVHAGAPLRRLRGLPRDAPAEEAHADPPRAKAARDGRRRDRDAAARGVHARDGRRDVCTLHDDGRQVLPRPPLHEEAILRAARRALRGSARRGSWRARTARSSRARST